MGMNRNLVIAHLAQVERHIRESERHLSRQREIVAELERHGQQADLVWVQEEPANQGAMFNMLPRLKRLAGERPVLSVKRSSSPSPATGSAKAHEVEQKTLLTLAFTIK